MRKPIIAGNWKMHKTAAEAKIFVASVVEHVPSQEKIESVICAPTLFLEKIVEATANSDVQIGAQTMHFEDEGAFTGETSPLALKDIGVSFVIIGHSERRALFNETDETVNKKVHAAFQHQLTPIVCVGETLEQKENELTKTIVEAQVVKALTGLTENQVEQTVLAYEPIWAIGTGKSSNPTDANEVCTHIRHVVSKNFSTAAARAIRIQYGGSVNPQNIAEYMIKENIDGALVGGASLQADSFLQLLEAALDV